MALVIYDHGYRIQTPVDSLLPARVVEQLTKMQPGRALSDMEKNFIDPDRAALPYAPHPPPNPKFLKAQQAYQSTRQVNRRQSDQPELTIDRIMTTPVISIRQNAKLSTAWQLMQTHRIQHLAVVGQVGQLLGVLTEGDLLRRNSPAPYPGPVIPRETIAGGYSSQLIVATPDTLVQQVALILLDRRLSCMPIVRTDGVLAGIVTRSDLLPLIINDKRLSRYV